MASTPTFFGTICVGRVTASTANTARDGTGTLATVNWTGGGSPSAPATGPASDWQLNRIVISETADLADCVITVFAFDGTNTWVLTDIDVNNPTAASATVTGLVVEVAFADYRFPAGVDLKFGLTAAPTSGTASITVFAERA